MCRLVSLHGILPSEEARGDHIDEVYHIDPEDREGSCDLASADDSESREEEGEHDRP